MIHLVVTWISIVLVVEAVTEILVKGDIFINIRAWIGKKSSFFGKLFSCGYCMSVWISFLAIWITPGEITSLCWVDMILKLFVIHRLSNVIHELIARWINRIPFILVFNGWQQQPTDIIVEGGDGQEDGGRKKNSRSSETDDMQGSK